MRFDIDQREEDGACATCGEPGKRRITRFYSEPNPICDACRAAAAEAEAEREAAEREEIEREIETRRIAARLRASGMPSGLHDLPTPDRQPDALASARLWIAGELPGLLLTGEPGTGKTFIAAWAAWQRLMTPRATVGGEGDGSAFSEYELRQAREGQEVRRPEQLYWTTGPALMAALTQPFESQERMRAHKMLTGTGPLILDDLDKTRATDYGAEQVFLAVDNAVTNERPLIVTTNQQLSELAAKWPYNGPAVASRLRGYCRRHQIQGYDRRLEEARKRERA